MPETKNRSSNQPMQRKRARSHLVLCFAMVAPLLSIACPRGNDRPDNSRVGISTRVQTSEPIAPIASSFNGERALEHVRKQLEIGPRPPSSPELAKTREYLLDQLRSSGLSVRTDDFVAKTPLGEKQMVNITAELTGESKDVIMFCSHYDTKYYKDMRFLGANDPGASVGTLLELARVLASQKKPRLTYWFVFFDGEEAFCEGWEECNNHGAPDNTYGSRHFVAELEDKNQLGRVRAMILFDLMGYKNLELGRDDMSTKWLVDIIWQTARELGYSSQFVDRPEGVGGDDHEPFLRAGVNAVDIIQLSSYPYWHKADDTLDKVSSRSMKIVGDVVLASLPRIEDRLLRKS